MQSTRLSPHPTARPLLLALLLAGVWATPIDARSASRYSFPAPRDALARADTLPVWQAMLQRHRTQLPELEACLSDASRCPRHLRDYRLVIERARDIPPRRQLQAVNLFINKRHRSEDDSQDNGGAWASPVDFLRGGGDREDFAVAKYFMLRELGFAVDDLRIVSAWDRKERDLHAVVAANVGGEAFLLETDNTIRRREEHEQYVFLFSINEHLLWDHHMLDAIPHEQVDL